MNIDSQILKALRNAGEASVSGVELSQKLGLTRAAIWARVSDLRSLGYEIEAQPHSGYRLVSAPDLLHADDLLSQLPRSQKIGRDIRVFQETTSTSDIVEKLARDGVDEGVVVFAEAQTKGRGRLGRKWVSPAGKGLWFSILLRPRIRLQEATQLTIASCVALRRAIQAETELPATIKWPNDILVRGKKVAGILTELRAELDRVAYAMVGIGVDVNLNANDFSTELKKTATSLKLESAGPVPRAQLAVRVLSELDADYARVRDGEFERVADEWEKHCATIGLEVTIRMADRQVRGRAESLAEDGSLLVRTEHGHLESVIGGDVTVEK
jgi:BirA family transcriptional regulator, biotin operon repressor / biotin---[acetyl-CoA-carboxylase] ligase